MLGEALRLIRVYHDLKQAEAAEKLGLSSSYISEIEKGHKEPSLDVLKKYGTTFGIPVSSIMFFSENIDDPGINKNVKSFVAGKILRILQLIEDKSEHIHAK